MASFAERLGHRASRTLTQSDELDADTRTELWNVTSTLHAMLHTYYRDKHSKVEANVLTAIWTWEFKNAADEEPPSGQVWGLIKKTILGGEWFDALDLIEAIIGYVKRYEDVFTQEATPVVVDAYNNRFEHFLVGYRFIGLEITPVGTTAEGEAVSSALDDSASIKGARHALERAVELLADRQKPDYPNSIKESISAVEAVCVAVTGEQTLGAALKKLKGAGVTIHPALEQAWSKMYGWTSDADGIRHGSIDAPDADQALAKYMLVACSGFVSLVIEEGRKAQLI